MKTSALIALAGLVCSISAAYAAPSVEAAPAKARWKVEVRDVRTPRGSTVIDPAAGRLVASFDLAQNGEAARLGDDIPYVDPRSVTMHPRADGSGHGSVSTLTLHTGLSVQVDGTVDLPVVHARSVDLLGFDQVMTSGTYVTQPRTTTTEVDLPFVPGSNAVVAGGYSLGRERSPTMRVFVVSRL